MNRAADPRGVSHIRPAQRNVCTTPPPPERVGRAAARRGECGQASVELVGLLPLVALLGLIGFTSVAAYSAHEQAGEAAGAGALAVLQGGIDPHDAARDALPKHVRSRATITVTGGRVHVRVVPNAPIPGLGERLAGEATANAGPVAP